MNTTNQTWGEKMSEKIKIKEFRVRYIGTEKTDVEMVESILTEGNFDEGGMFEVEEMKPTIEVCKACGGIGNVDEGAGFELDCNECGGKGFVEVKWWNNILW
jgi:DnaJ-class molecular chaperone